MSARRTHASRWALAGAIGLVAQAVGAPLPNVHNLVAIEFVESPPTGLVVSGGLLGVPDSTGGFPVPYRRFDAATGNFADPGRVAGDALLFTNLRPGTYRVAMVFLDESKLAGKLLPKHKEKLEDHCLVYGDSIPELTFTVRDSQYLYLGRLVRRSMPTLSGAGDEALWNTRVFWSPGDELKVLKSQRKRKELEPWQELIEARLAVLDSSAAEQHRPANGTDHP